MNLAALAKSEVVSVQMRPAKAVELETNSAGAEESSEVLHNFTKIVSNSSRPTKKEQTVMGRKQRVHLHACTKWCLFRQV